MADLSREELQRLARLGAQRRLEELRREEASILAAFPDLDRAPRARAGGRRVEAAASSDTGAASGRARKGRRRRMSAAERKAVSERMKKYWAARRKSKE